VQSLWLSISVAAAAQQHMSTRSCSAAPEPFSCPGLRARSSSVPSCTAWNMQHPVALFARGLRFPADLSQWQQHQQQQQQQHI